MDIISSIELEPEKGCHLLKNNEEYIVVSYIKNKFTEIKKYKELKSENLQARKNENLPNGASRYIIRIGLKKFVIDIKDDEIKYVMDLC